MKIFLLLALCIIVILFIGKKFFYSLKRSLFKDQAAWSGKDITIKHSNLGEVSDSIKNDNFLKMIADESEIYLDAQSNEGEG